MKTKRNTSSGLKWFVGFTIGLAATAGTHLYAQQPTIGTSPGEPHWKNLLAQQWGLDVDRDLRNPVFEGVAPAAIFRKVKADKPVAFKPLIALGLETTTRGGWYRSAMRAGVAASVPASNKPFGTELWSYTHKQSAGEIKSGKYTPPPLETGSVEFDPGTSPFGLRVSNDNFDDGGVYSQPCMTALINQRLKGQPYKCMIYPNRDLKTGRLITHSYIIGWEYSTNDDFQDVVTQIDNVRLLPSDPHLPGALAPDAKVKKLATGFKFVEGPTWDAKNKALYFSDIPQAHIVRYAEGKAVVANENSRQSNGLMVDKKGRLVACEHGGRRVSRAVRGQPADDIVTHYKDKRLNSPNDLWIDAEGGIYFTDPRYGERDTMEMKIEGVYYIAPDGKLTRVIDDLVRPNGIALSPDGKSLYVVDNGAHTLHRYAVVAPGKLGKGERIAYVTHPDGMTVDVKGRLYVTGELGVWVLDANGKWLGLIETPERPANCTFGGPGYKTLFITAQTSLYAIETQTRGWHIHLDGVPKKK